MKKNAIFCVNIVKDKNNPIKEFDFALQTFEKYCQKYNLDLIVVDKPKYSLSGNNSYNYIILEKFQIHKYFEKYDRILKIDLDTLITASCPNVFDIVPYDSVGVLIEDIGKRRKDRHQQMQIIQSIYGQIPNWNENYFNAGIIVMSKCHNKANELTQEDIINFTSKNIGLLREQNVMNWKIRNQGYKIFPLDYRYNHMFMFDEVNWMNIKSGSLWKNRAKNSFILHYAGLRGKLRYKRMKKDFKKVIREWDKVIDY